MVKPGGDSPVEAATVSSHSTQPPGSSEWRFVSTSRPRMKRAGTPFPETARRDLKRAGLETISGVSRIKKKMVFEMADELLAGDNGEGSVSLDERQPKVGPMLETLAQMARPGPFEAASGHLLLFDHERHFTVGISDVNLAEPPAGTSPLEVEGLTTEMSSNKDDDLKDFKGDYFKEEEMVEMNATEGVSEVAGQSSTTEIQDGSSSSGERNNLVVESEKLTGVDCLTAISNLEESEKTDTTSILGACAQPSSFGVHKTHLLKSNDVDYQNSLLAACVERVVSYACDNIVEDNANLLLGAQEVVTPNLVMCSMNSNPTPRENSLSPQASEDNQLLEEGLSTGVDVDAAGQPPVPTIQPASEGEVPGSGRPRDDNPPFDKETQAVPDGAAGTSDGGEEGKGRGGFSDEGSSPSEQSAKLDAGSFVDLGTAGVCGGIPSLSFSNDETKFLAEKIGHAIIGKFSHSIPSPKQIQQALSNIQFVGGFKWKSMNAKHILIQFRDAGDYARMLNGPNGAPVWYVDNHPMRVFKWSPDFDTFFESPIAVVWCKVLGLPIHLYDQSALIAIGKLLGKPILADHATINQTRLAYARICVEIDISKPPPEEIILNILGKDTRYKVVWDRIPLFCVECKHVGHVKEACHALGKKDKPPMKEYNRNTHPRRPDHALKAFSREWRPKEPKSVNHNRKPDRSATVKEGVEPEMHEEKRATSPKAPMVPQVQVDEEGFQLVTKRWKGKSSYPLHQGQEGSHKVNYLEKLLKGGNVATVSFGEANVEVIDPGGGRWSSQATG